MYRKIQELTEASTPRGASFTQSRPVSPPASTVPTSAMSSPGTSNPPTLQPEQIFKCSKCTLSFPSVLEITRHMSDIHTKNVPFTCSYCKRSFQSYTKMRRHIDDDHRVLCPVCGKQFLKTSLPGHLKNKHNDFGAEDVTWDQGKIYFNICTEITKTVGPWLIFLSSKIQFQLFQFHSIFYFYFFYLFIYFFFIFLIFSSFFCLF